ncbi:MAG: M20 family metallopeptidase [Candidatus Tectomicrobia bacterium]|uniref:Peptidase M20 domain-containing protein 2 n=1 Tax=Tectimicrobiota bacterium TaxID=2528274 RepID=A0A932FXK5_UNCTE|nr:M20 family metallopeptidase [Candidatus Tectomicrobia bacterium]
MADVEIQRDSLAAQITAQVDRLQDALEALSASLHAEPEIGFQEHRSAEKLIALLSQEGFAIEREIGGLPTAFRAAWGEEGKGPTLAFLAEYDALPGLGHACGHNLIAASSLGAALALKRSLPRLEGRILVLGTPAEEGGGGKVTLLEQGAFAGVDIALMVHPNSRTQLRWKSLAMASVKLAFTGKAAHAAASPHQGVNALDALILTYNNLNALRQQLRDDARIHGIITEGGRAPNIIPDHTAAWFYLRSLAEDYLHELLEKFQACAQGAAQATGCRLEWEVSPLIYQPFKPNRALEELFRSHLARFGVAESPPAPEGMLGSSDIGNVSQRIPTLHAELAICPEGIALHTPEFAQAAISERGRQGLLLAAKALALTALDLFLSPEKRQEVQRDF